ncbi:MAG: ABC transporter permease [Rhizobiaceae bacterium]
MAEHIDEIPDIKQDSKPRAGDGPMNFSALTNVPVARDLREALFIVAFAVLLVVSLEVMIRLAQVPSYILPLPSNVFAALFRTMPAFLPHIGVTLQELLIGYSIGAVIGILMAGVITQFPFVEKVITPYVILLVTTPMLALVPLLVLQLGFGIAPRVVAVALAVGPMVMINSATGFRRTDPGKIALARSYGASTLQIFRTIRFPIALPMIIVGLMVGGIFGLLTAIGAEMLGGQWGLGTRLVYYSSLARMEEFFATILIVAFIGVIMYVIFFFIGKKWASWEA